MTRIAFLCSSLEAGRDGVGDYVRQFARHLTRNGHACLLVALADRFVRSPTFTPDTDPPIVRIPAESWARGETRVAEEALERFKPDWISLQMVCYGYEKHGLLLRSARGFERLRRFGSRHMMFHELWIGESRDDGLKDRAVGWLQKKLLLRTTRTWAPDVVHTSNPLYCELLRRNGVLAEELPLPGNIPIVATDAAAARRWLLQRVRGDDDPAPPGVLVGVFGSIHPQWRDTGWLGALYAQCVREKRWLAVVHVGRMGPRGESVWRALREPWLGRIEFHALGEISAAEVSQALLALDLGVATSPWPLIGKSGSVSAMLEHGVPVVVTRDDFRLRRGAAPEPSPHPLLSRFDAGLVNPLPLGTPGPRPPQASDEIYDRFLDSLATAGDARIHALVTGRV